MIAQSARRLRNVRRLVIVGGLVLAAAYGLLERPVNRLLSPGCPEAPTYDPDTRQDIRGVLDTLHGAGVLLCPAAPQGLAGLGDKVYWGTDGLRSVLYFDFDAASPVSVQRYEYRSTTNEPVLGPGDRAPAGFFVRGRPAYRNEAPEGASFYYIVMAGPQERTAAVRIRFVGRRAPQGGLAGRDLFTDLADLWSRLHGTTPGGRQTVELDFPIDPAAAEGVGHRWVTPELAGDKGEPDLQALMANYPDEPTLYQVVSGPLGAGIWVAGVITGTRPAMVLTTAHLGADGFSVPAEATEMWEAWRGHELLALFAFGPYPGDSEWLAHYWNDAARRDAPADAVFGPFTFATGGAAEAGDVP
ncbi:MAG: hypothetical protein ACE5EL_01100 [Anaerolineae bacterium]